MTSLLQFKGNVSRKGCQLAFYLESEIVTKITSPYRNNTYWITSESKKKHSLEMVECVVCGLQHEQLYLAWRRPCGQFGHFIVFRYLGDEHVPDLSLPIAVPKVPKGSVKLSPVENGQYWHKGG